MRAGGAMRRHRYPGVGPAHEAGNTTVALDVGAAGRRGAQVEVLR